MRIVILDSYTTDAGQDVWQGLRRFGEVTVYPRTEPADLAARLADCEIAIINKTRLPADALAGAASLRYIGLLSTGTDVVDLVAARLRQVAVANVPGYSTESVAQLVFAHILHWAVDVGGHAAAVRKGQWAAQPDFAFALRPMRELHGRCIAVFGSGAIGSAVARIAKGFGMRVLSGQVPGSQSIGRLPLHEILPQAHVVSLHCPLTPATKQMVDANFLARMRPDSLLVNTSRGGLIDEAALRTALAHGHLSGVSLDVLVQEPPPSAHPLLAADAPWAERLVVTPHLAWMTGEARMRLVDEATANVAAFLAGEIRNRVDR